MSDQSHGTVCRLQCQRKIYCHGGRAAATFGIYDGENFAANVFLLDLALRGRKADESFKQIGSRRGLGDEFLGSRAHCLHDDLRLRHRPDCESRCIRHFLLQHFNSMQGHQRIIWGISTRTTSGEAL
jgi:hypothetical protein